MEPQSPTPERPDDVKPAATPPPAPPDSITNGPAETSAAEAAGSPEAAPPAPPLTPMGWLKQNSPFLLLAVAVIGAIYHYLDFDGLVRCSEVGVGLCLLIFIHELGHFLAAKWCGVRVQTFSLGFGPALPGCSFQYGETTYKIGVIPLGGFVQMTGEGTDGDEEDNDPRSYKNKTVLQRMLIISAGVVMNMLLGCVCFVIVYQFHGVPMPPAVVWRVDAGSPAWKAGIPSGAVFTDINGGKKPTFEELKVAVALDSWWTGTVHLEYQTLDGQTSRVDLRPRDDSDQPVIGVLPPPKLQLWPAKNPLGYGRPALDNSPAAAARAVDLWYTDVVVRASDPSKEGDAVTDLPHDLERGTFDAAELCDRMRGLGNRDMVLYVVRGATRGMKGPPEDKLVVPAKGFEADDLIALTTDPDHPDDVLRVKELRTKAGGDSHQDYIFFDYQERMKRLAGKPVIIQVRRQTKGPNDALTSSLVNVLVPPAYHQTLGMRMKMGEVSAIRDHSPASDKVQDGDKIVAARVTTGGTPLLDLPEEMLDPVRLPFELERAAARAPVEAPVQVALTVKRWDDQAHVQKDVELTLGWEDAWRFDEERSMSEASAMAIPELGIAYRVESTVVHVEPGSAADKAGIQENDRIEEICFKKRQKDGSGEWDVWNPMKSDRAKSGGAADASYDQWAYYFSALQSLDFPEVKVRVWRGAARLPQDLELNLKPDRNWPEEQRGLLLQSDLTLDKADNILEAMGKGIHRTWSFARQLYMGFANILTGRISFTKHAEGPIALARDTFEAAQDPYMLILWLGLISVNLAVVNFLPIPVLDGGHMVFLIYELIRRRPPSDAVRAAATYVGLAALGLLMLFVICLDIMHLPFWTHK